MVFAKRPETIRVRFLQSIASAEWSFSPGEVVDLPRRAAEVEIRTGRAELAPPDAPLGMSAAPPPLGCARCGSSPTVPGHPFCAPCLGMIRGRR
jgi:hypothetical protein